ncbi:xanthine dehydrogenase family protein subunit M [Sphingomonas sp.]|uniref:FAD binding domain-containing protein n=1 Tax=Sphingomonas sp. TaxID=28214 RepID=UPI0035A87C56|nr:carbon monoxide dehydrogenase [Parvibaculum sp.]
MIPGEFEYRRPSSKAEALTMLAAAGDGGRLLAGGHSLIPMMKLRMATPTTLVDLRRLDELRSVTISDTIAIGAAVTQHEIIVHDGLTEACPILRETALLIADPQVRYCGTLGGNVGNGDPGNDMPAVMQCLDADYVVESVGGTRIVKAREFYQGAYFTALLPGEIISEIRIRRPAIGHGFAYTKLKRKVGDYATAAAAVMLELAGGKVRSASIALTNVAPTPLYATEAVAVIADTALDIEHINAAVRAAEAITDPSADGRGSAEYRRSMAGVMVRRALEKAKARAV